MEYPLSAWHSAGLQDQESNTFSGSEEPGCLREQMQGMNTVEGTVEVARGSYSNVREGVTTVSKGRGVF